MVNEMVDSPTDRSAPIPSVEAILHAVVPHKFVDHTHADAIVAISNSVNGRKNIKRNIQKDRPVYSVHHARF